VREADPSPPFSFEVKNARSHTSTPPYVFMVQLGQVHLYRNFTFMNDELKEMGKEIVTMGLRKTTKSSDGITDFST
jgi:hypothetical protein